MGASGCAAPCPRAGQTCSGSSFSSDGGELVLIEATSGADGVTVEAGELDAEPAG